MSQRGHIVLFSEEHQGDWRELSKQVFRIIGARSIYSAWKSVGQSLEWNEFLSESEYQPTETPGVYTLNDSDEESLGRNLPLEKIEDFLVGEQEMISLNVQADLGLKLWNAFQEEIAECLRGPFAPNDIELRFGDHDIFDPLEGDEGRFLGRANFSFGISDDGCPNDWAQYREKAIEVSEFLALKEKLSEIIKGDLTHCIYWS